MTFNQWMLEVDNHLASMSGLSSADLADQCYRDQFDDGLEPREAAESCLEANDYPIEAIHNDLEQNQ